MKPTSKRFNPSTWSEKLVPVLFVVIAVGLIITFAIIAFSMLGLTPSF